MVRGRMVRGRKERGRESRARDTGEAAAGPGGTRPGTGGGDEPQDGQGDPVHPGRKGEGGARTLSAVEEGEEPPLEAPDHRFAAVPSDSEAVPWAAIPRGDGIAFSDPPRPGVPPPPPDRDRAFPSTGRRG
jgi:hypothetical protein